MSNARELLPFIQNVEGGSMLPYPCRIGPAEPSWIASLSRQTEHSRLTVILRHHPTEKPYSSSAAFRAVYPATPTSLLHTAAVPSSEPVVYTRPLSPRRQPSSDRQMRCFSADDSVVDGSRPSIIFLLVAHIWHGGLVRAERASRRGSTLGRGDGRCWG